MLKVIARRMGTHKAVADARQVVEGLFERGYTKEQIKEKLQIFKDEYHENYKSAFDEKIDSFLQQ